MVFRKRGNLLPDESFIYNNSKLDIVNDFNYLGTVFNYTGSFGLNIQQLVGKALKALNVLMINCRKYNMKPKILCQLFDAFVGSILSYASQIWGYSKSKEIERIHLKFCKHILKVRNSTSTMAVYGELGRYPLYISRYIKIVKYWHKIINTDNIILQHMYTSAYNDCILGRKNWLTNVKQILCDYGFNNVWDNPETCYTKAFINIFKQRAIDCFMQEWHTNIETSPVLELYRNIKFDFSYERYLDVLPGDLKTYVCKIRISAHSLRIQTGRYARNRIPRSERYCIYCNTNDLEDEFHFILICSCYSDIRKKYIRKYFYQNPSMYKFIELLKSDNRTNIVNLAYFIKNALSIRTTLTHT